MGPVFVNFTIMFDAPRDVSRGGVLAVGRRFGPITPRPFSLLNVFVPLTITVAVAVSMAVSATITVTVSIFVPVLLLRSFLIAISLCHCFSVPLIPLPVSISISNTVAIAVAVSPSGFAIAVPTTGPATTSSETALDPTSQILGLSSFVGPAGMYDAIHIQLGRVTTHVTVFADGVAVAAIAATTAASMMGAVSTTRISSVSTSVSFLVSPSSRRAPRGFRRRRSGPGADPTIHFGAVHIGLIPV